MALQLYQLALVDRPVVELMARNREHAINTAKELFPNAQVSAIQRAPEWIDQSPAHQSLVNRRT